jgi:hypothetical protein
LPLEKDRVFIMANFSLSINFFESLPKKWKLSPASGSLTLYKPSISELVAAVAL